MTGLFFLAFSLLLFYYPKHCKIIKNKQITLKIVAFYLEK